MIDEIKKEIKKTFYIDEDDMHFEIANINIDTLFKILDKYNNQPDYKSDIELFNLANKTLQDKINNLNKGIDKILKKYEDEKRKIIEDMTILSKYTGSINELLQKQVVLTIIEETIQYLKSLKGE